MSNGVRIWLEVDKEGFVHGGEYLRAVFCVESSSAAAPRLTLATIRLVGEVELSGSFIDARLLHAVLRERPHVYGAGALTHESKNRHFRPLERSKTLRFSLLESLPTVVAADLRLEGNSRVCIEWIMYIPVAIIPSFHGQHASLRYSLIAEAQVDMVGTTRPPEKVASLEHIIHILHPFLQQPQSPQHHQSDIPHPFRFYRFADIPRIASDLLQIKAYSRQIEPKIPEESVWQRYRKEGILPSSVWDFDKYPLHPLIDRFQCSNEPPPNASSRFNILALDSRASTVDVQLEDSTIAQVHISKSFLQLGEKVVCMIQFPQADVVVYHLKAQLICTETVGQEYRHEAAAVGQFSTEHQVKSREAVCWMHRQVTFPLSLPSNVPTTLWTDLMTIQWSLELILLCSARAAEPMIGGSSMLESAPTEQRPTSLLKCSVPLHVVPSIPISLYANRFNRHN